jgi:RND family efflux transporter MFP subunit
MPPLHCFLISKWRGFRVAILAGLSIVPCVFSGCTGSQAPAGVTQAKPIPPVIFDFPIEKEVTDFEDFVGQTEAVKTVMVRARVTGYLDKVNFEDGAEVAEDAVLFEIDPRSYQATAARTAAGVKQGDAHLKRLDLDNRRAQNLTARGVMPREEFDKISGDFSEAESMLASSKADNELAQLNLSFTKVTAPIAGRLSRRMVDPGNLVKADDTMLTTIVSLDPMHVNFDIDERTLLRLRRLVLEGKIKPRAEADVPIQAALADEDDYPHTGKINFSDNRLDASTGTLRLRAEIANPVVNPANKTRVFTPGLYVKIRLPVGVPHKSVLVPEEAVGTDQGRKFLYLINAENKIIQRPVTIGSRDGVFRVIASGLTMEEKARVVVRGLQRVRLNEKVNPQRLPSSDSLSSGPEVKTPAKAAEKKSRL